MWKYKLLKQLLFDVMRQQTTYTQNIKSIIIQNFKYHRKWIINLRRNARWNIKNAARKYFTAYLIKYFNNVCYPGISKWTKIFSYVKLINRKMYETCKGKIGHLWVLLPTYTLSVVAQLIYVFQRIASNQQWFINER